MARLYNDPTQNPALRSALMAAGRAGAITTPPQQDFDTPAMEGSLQQFLADNLGQYVVIEFLVGTQHMTAKSGLLYAVGTSVVTLYQELSQTFVTCDLFSIKFVTFYLPGRRPWQVSNPAFGGVPSPRTEPDYAPPADLSLDMGVGAPADWPQGLPTGQAPPSWG